MRKGSSPRRGGGPSNFSRGRPENDEADVERSPQQTLQENPEMPESGAAATTARAPEEDYGQNRAPEDDRSRGERSPRENGNAEEHKSRFSSQEKGPDYGSPPREQLEEEEEQRYRRRGSRSGSQGSRGRRSNRSSPRHNSPRNNRPRREDSREGGRDNGPFTQVYVTGFSRSSRREDLEYFFSRGGRDSIHEVIMKSRFAFIEFKTPESALSAVQEFDNAEFEGRKLTVQRSYPDGSKRRRRTTGPQAADECWTCGKRGHWANDCESRYGGKRRHSPRRRSRSPPRRYQRRSRSRSHDGHSYDGRSRELREGRCFICHQKGHIKRDCPEARGGRQGERRDDYRDRYHHSRRSPSRSRSPHYRRRGGHDMGDRMRSPPRRHHYSRSPARRPYSRSPPHEERYRPAAAERDHSRD